MSNFMGNISFYTFIIQVIVDSKTKEVETLITEIQNKTEVVKSSSETAAQKQEEAVKQSKIIEEEKNKADSALMEALPAIEAAAEALNNIRREDLQELKAFNNPPIHKCVLKKSKKRA